MDAHPESLALLFKSFRLPTMAALVDDTIGQAERENWSYAQLLRALCEAEYQDRQRRKHERLAKQAQLPAGKTLASLDQTLLPVKARRLLPSLLDGGFVDRGDNVLAFGLPGRGKTHYLCAVASELIGRHQYRVLFTSTFKLVQQLLIARGELSLDRQLRKLDGYDVIIVDDLGYVQQSREEMEVLFTFFSHRYERRSLMISSNLVFSQWDQIFKDPMTTMAAIDRLVHHAVVLEFTGESIRMQHAQQDSAQPPAGAPMGGR
jgi:DNA replication protein DnaC